MKERRTDEHFRKKGARERKKMKEREYGWEREEEIEGGGRGLECGQRHISE